MKIVHILNFPEKQETWKQVFAHRLKLAMILLYLNTVKKARPD